MRNIKLRPVRWALVLMDLFPRAMAIAWFEWAQGRLAPSHPAQSEIATKLAQHRAEQRAALEWLGERR